MTVRWVVTKTDQSIYVDDELRYKGSGDFSTLNKPITIFGGHGSIVTVQSLTTKQLN